MSCAFLVSKDVILSAADLPKDFAAVLIDIVEDVALPDTSPLSTVPFTSTVEEGEALGTGVLTAAVGGLTTLAGSTLGGVSWGSGTGSGTLPSKKLVIVRSTFCVCTARIDNALGSSVIENNHEAYKEQHDVDG